jgi:hypothetical protein
LGEVWSDAVWWGGSRVGHTGDFNAEGTEDAEKRGLAGGSGEWRENAAGIVSARREKIWRLEECERARLAVQLLLLGWGRGWGHGLAQVLVVDLARVQLEVVLEDYVHGRATWEFCFGAAGEQDGG